MMAMTTNSSISVKPVRKLSRRRKQSFIMSGVPFVDFGPAALDDARSNFVGLSRTSEPQPDLFVNRLALNPAQSEKDRKKLEKNEHSENWRLKSNYIKGLHDSEERKNVWPWRESLVIHAPDCSAPLVLLDWSKRPVIGIGVRI